MGSTIEYEIGHYYKRVYGKHCWTIFCVIGLTPSSRFIKVQVLKQEGFYPNKGVSMRRENFLIGGWKTVELNENELVWEVL